MKVILKNGKTQEVNDSYGLRLITQGRAVMAAPDKKKTVRKSEKASPPGEKDGA